MVHLSGVSRRPASLPRVQESSGTVSRGAGAEVTVRVQESDPVTRWSASQVISQSPCYPTRYLLPTEQMNDALAIDQIKPKALDLAPLSLPRGSPGPLASLPWATTPSISGASRRVGAINTKNHHGSAPFTRCDLVDARVDLLTRRRHIQHAEGLGRSIRERMHPLTAEVDAGEVVKQGLGLVIGGLDTNLAAAFCTSSWVRPGVKPSASSSG
jgi:hypothetical protein